MKPVCFVLSALILAVVLQYRPSLACIGSVCQLHQLQLNGTGVFLLSGQAQYFPPNSPTTSLTGNAGQPVRYFNKTYNVHIHSPQDDGRHHSAFLKIVDKFYFVIKTPDFENGESTWSNMTVVALPGNGGKTSTEEEMEKLLHSILINIRRVQTDGTRLIFRGRNVSNLVCNRVPAL